MSHIRGLAAGRLAAAGLSLTLVGGTAAVTTTTASAAPAAPAAAPAAAALGACNILLEGEVRYRNGVKYTCVHVKGIGWLWVPQSFFGCGAAPARVTRTC